MQQIKHIAGIGILTFVVGVFFLTDRIPYSDEYSYLGHSYSLYIYGVFGVVDDNNNKSIADARYTPVLPLAIATVMLMSENFANSIICYLHSEEEKRKNCPNNLMLGKVLLLLLFSVCVSYIWVLIFEITTSKIFSYTTVVMLLFSGSPYHYASHFLTESIYLGFAFIFLLSLPLAILKQSLKYTVISSVFLGLTALSRPTYLYLFYLLLLTFPVLLLFKNKYFLNKKFFVKFCSVFFISFFVIVGPWMTRNLVQFDKFTLTAGYGDKPLATRVAHNDMTNKEYIAGWVYWLPDFGDSLAEKIFGKENIHRLSFSSSESFYPAGRNKVDQVINEAMTHGKNGIVYTSRLEAILDIYIYPDLLNHAKTTLLLAWRGFFVDKYYALFGLFFVIWTVLFGLKGQQLLYYHLVLIPALILLFFQAAVSVSIPRYNLILLLPIAMAYSASFSLFISKLLNKLQKKVNGKTSK